MTRVPAIALPKPPPCSSGAGGSWVNTARLNLRAPCQASIRTTENSGTSDRSVMPVTSALSRKSIRVRGRRSDRSSCEKSTAANGSTTSCPGCPRSMLAMACIKTDSVSARQGRALDDRRPDDVDDQGDTEEDQSRVHQDAGLFRARFREVVREKRGQRIRRREERHADPVGVAH